MTAPLKSSPPLKRPTPSRRRSSRSWNPRLDEAEEFQAPVLRFSPAAWAKILFFRDAGNTEIGGFGVTASDDALYVEDFQTVAQETSAVTVAFDDEAVADFFEAQVDAGRRPASFARLWIHTHPGACPRPSATDEETFARVFGPCDYAFMVILARGGDVYGRLSFSAGPGADLAVTVAVDHRRPFAGSDHAAWKKEYEMHVRRAARQGLAPRDIFLGGDRAEDFWGTDGQASTAGTAGLASLADLADLEPGERDRIIAEAGWPEDLEAWVHGEEVDGA
jgi:proteasome lid subunit RPN8/RPN11